MDRPRALVTRNVDFWLLGGASIVVWAVMIGLQGWREGSGPLSTFARTRFSDLVASAAILTIVVNHPHFMASYKLAYGRGWAYVRERWFALLAVPAVLVALLAFAFLEYGRGIDGGTRAAFPWLSSALGAIGLNSPLHPTATTGGAVMTLLVQTMFLSVGWHYSKQAYGCMMTYAGFDGYPLDGAQRALLRWTLHGIWFSSFVGLNVHRKEHALSNIPFYGLGFPFWLLLAVQAVTAIGFLLVWLRIVKPNLAKGFRPSACFLVPMAAFAVWWFPMLDQTEFGLILTPTFHGLQYLPFVWRVESTTARRANPLTADLRLTATAFALVVVGVLAFELVPNSLDAALDAPRNMNAFFFAAAISIFINVHHYFIDSVIWRSKDPHVQAALFAKETEAQPAPSTAVAA